MRSHLAGLILVAVVVGLGTSSFAAERTPPARPSSSQASTKIDLSGVAQLWTMASKAGIFAGIPDMILDRVFKAGVQLLSGNDTSLLAKNKLLSDNRTKLLSDIKPTVLSKNRLSLFSNIKVEINITVNDNGNHSANGNEASARGSLEHAKGR
jgi:hypothetical protein